MTKPHHELTSWPAPDRIATPAGNTIHVYKTVVPPELAPAWTAALSTDERERAARLRVGHAARRFITARAAVRSLLGACLDLPPDAVPLQVAPQGKPHVDHSPVAFNLSHAGDLVLVAITWAGPIGIDVECLTPPRSWETVAARFFTPAERATLATAPETERWRAFLTLWTRKEALAKQSGEGLWSVFKQGEDHASLAPPTHTVIDLEPAPDYLAALACASHAGPVHTFTWCGWGL